MVKPSRRQVIALMALALAAGVAFWLQRGGTPSLPGAQQADAGGTGSDLPRIGLDRLGANKAKATVGKRDLFDFGTPVATAPGQGTPAPSPSPTAGFDLDPFGDAAPTPTPVPTLSLKYVGSVSDKRGFKVAVLMTDRKELLTGQAGELVANRFRIVNIGLESVDIQDVGSDRVRRIPLKAN
jgi:hypothetical protein